jgi:hypothetical protein
MKLGKERLNKKESMSFVKAAFHLISLVCVVLFILDAIIENIEDKWPDPKVIVNKIKITKELVFEDPSLRFFSIELAKIDARKNDNIVLFNCDRFLLLDKSDFRILQNIPFKGIFSKKEGCSSIFRGDSIVSLPNGKYGIASQGGGFVRAAITDSDGELLWKLPNSENRFMDQMFHADLDYDSIEELYTLSNEGVYKTSVDGSIQWLYPGKYYKIAPIKGSSHSNSAIILLKENIKDENFSKLIFLNSFGKVIKEKVLNTALKEIVTIKGLDKELIIGRYDRMIYFFNIEGELQFKYNFSDIPIYHGPEASFVRFNEKGDFYIAVSLSSNSKESRSILTLFSLKGELVYQEVSTRVRGILSAPGKMNELLSIESRSGKLWSYKTQ